MTRRVRVSARMTQLAPHVRGRVRVTRSDRMMVVQAGFEDKLPSKFQRIFDRQNGH